MDYIFRYFLTHFLTKTTKSITENTLHTRVSKTVIGTIGTKYYLSRRRDSTLLWSSRSPVLGLVFDVSSFRTRLSGKLNFFFVKSYIKELSLG